MGMTDVFCAGRYHGSAEDPELPCNVGGRITIKKMNINEKTNYTPVEGMRDGCTAGGIE